MIEAQPNSESSEPIENNMLSNEHENIASSSNNVVLRKSSDFHVDSPILKKPVIGTTRSGRFVKRPNKLDL